GKPCVNCSNGKPSFISLESTTDVFTSGTQVTSVVDVTYNITFTPFAKHRGHPRHLPIRLHGRGTLKDVVPPDSGTLTVTIANPAGSYQVPVDYADDPT